MVGWSVAFPCDLVKSRMQMVGGERGSFLRVMGKIIAGDDENVLKLDCLRWCLCLYGVSCFFEKTFFHNIFFCQNLPSP